MASSLFPLISYSQDPSPVSSHHASNSTPRHRPRNHTQNQNHKVEPSSWPRHNLSQLFLITILLSCLFSLTSASKYIPIEEEMVERSPLISVGETESESLGSTFARLARSGTIIVDPRPPPEPANWDVDSDADADLDLRRRNLNSMSSSSSSAAAGVKTASVSSSSATLAATATTSGGIIAATTSSVASLPTPFDTGFNNNITTSCATFMNSMLSNATFKSCLPFSLLLQNSNSFFQASKSLVRISQSLDYSCSANLTQCTTLLTSFATSLPLTTNCASDLSAQNPTIQQAHLGLLAYAPLFSASCLRNPQTSSYCFADAITNASNPSDSYIYFLPLNVSLVGGSQPSCDACLKNTMAVFETATGEKGSAIRDTYASAANQVNVFCGPGFVNASLAAVTVGSGASPGTGFGGGVFMFVVLSMLASWLL